MATYEPTPAAFRPAPRPCNPSRHRRPCRSPSARFASAACQRVQSTANAPPLPPAHHPFGRPLPRRWRARARISSSPVPPGVHPPAHHRPIPPPLQRARRRSRHALACRKSSPYDPLPSAVGPPGTIWPSFHLTSRQLKEALAISNGSCSFNYPKNPPASLPHRPAVRLPCLNVLAHFPVTPQPCTSLHQLQSTPISQPCSCTKRQSRVCLNATFLPSNFSASYFLHVYPAPVSI